MQIQGGNFQLENNCPFGVVQENLTLDFFVWPNSRLPKFTDRKTTAINVNMLLLSQLQAGKYNNSWLSRVWGEKRNIADCALKTHLHLDRILDISAVHVRIGKCPHERIGANLGKNGQNIFL